MKNFGELEVGDALSSYEIKRVFEGAHFTKEVIPQSSWSDKIPPYGGVVVGIGMPHYGSWAVTILTDREEGMYYLTTYTFR